MIIAVLADDAKLRAQLVDLLAGQGHRVLPVSEPSACLESLRAGRPHLLVTALSAPATGLLKALREAPDARLLPVLCVDPSGGAADAVALLDAGADDAITRPFQAAVFLARVRTLLRRAVLSGGAPEEEATVLTAPGLEMRLLSRQLTADGRAVELTRLEFDLLAQFLRHPDRAFRREELLAAVWHYPGGVETRTLDKHVESLRRKLGACAEMLQTVHGVGYRLAPVAAGKKP